MTILPALIDAIDQADIPVAVYRTAVRLARLTDSTGRAVMTWEEYQALTGCSHADAARRHLRALRRAGLVSWRGGVTVVVVWLVNRHVVSENRQLVSESRPYVRVDNNSNGYYDEIKRPVVSARKKWLCPRPTVRVEKQAASVWKKTAAVGKQTLAARYLIQVRARADCLIDQSTKPVEEINNQTIKQSEAPARDDRAEAESLMVEVGIAPSTAKKLSVQGYALVERAVASWYTQRREAGGKLENHPGIVVYWLSNPDRAGIPATLPDSWSRASVGKKQPVNGNSYHVDIPDIPGIPGVVHLQPTGNAPPLPPPMPHDDPWSIALAELLPTLPGKTRQWLQDSQLTVNGELAGVPFYRVTVMTDPANIEWLKQQAEPAIRKKVSSILRKRVELEIVAAEPVAQGVA